MAFGSSKKDYPKMLDGVLKEYPKASDMPSSITQLTGYFEAIGKLSRDDAAKERDRLESRLIADESRKLYKSVNDKTGEVFLITNPITWERKANADKTFTMLRPKPRSMGFIEELIKNQSSGFSPADEDSRWGVG